MLLAALLAAVPLVLAPAGTLHPFGRHLQTASDSEAMMTMVTFSWGSEITWNITQNGNAVCSGGPYENYGEYGISSCDLNADAEYTLACEDSYGDGWHGGHLIIAGISYCHDFSTGHAQTEVLVLSNIAMVIFEWGSEITWSITQNGNAVCSGGPYENTAGEYGISSCDLNADAEYTLACEDSYGDGWHEGHLIIAGISYCHDFDSGHAQTEVFVYESAAESSGSTTTGPCSQSPCSHSGVCVEQNATDYTCNCAGTGFNGENCEQDVDECDSAPCEYTSSTSCVNGFDAFTCICQEGWQGSTCSESLYYDTTIQVMTVHTDCQGQCITAEVFGTGEVADQLTITNTGTTDLFIMDIEASVPWAQIGDFPSTAAIQGSQGITVDLLFQGASTAGTGQYMGNLTIWSNDPNNGSVVVAVSLTVAQNNYSHVALVAQPSRLDAMVTPTLTHSFSLSIWNTLEADTLWFVGGCECHSNVTGSALPCYFQEAQWITIQHCNGSIEALSLTQLMVKFVGPPFVQTYDYTFTLQQGDAAMPWPVATSLRVETSAELVDISRSFYSMSGDKDLDQSGLESCTPFVVSLHPRDMWNNTIQEDIGDMIGDCTVHIVNAADNTSVSTALLRYSFETQRPQVTVGGFPYIGTFELRVMAGDSLVQPSDAFEIASLEQSGMNMWVATAISCSTGHYANAVGNVCVPNSCPAGQQLSQESISQCSGCNTCSPCTACEPGQYSPENLNCQNCSAGSFSSNFGSEECDECAPDQGQYSTPGASSCETCPYGQGPVNDGSSCVDCPFGMQGRSHGLLGTCEPCSEGKVSADDGGPCTVCPPSFVISTLSDQRCECEPGFYSLISANFSFHADHSVYCRPCSELDLPSNVDSRSVNVCPGGPVGSAFVCPLEGKYLKQKGSNQLALLPCEGKHQCLSSSCCTGMNCTNVTQRSAKCGNGHTGYLCAECQPGYSKIAGICEECTGVDLVNVSLQITTIVLIGLAMFMKSLKVVVSSEQAERMFEEVDVDNSQTLDVEEIKVLMKRMGHALAQSGKIMTQMTGSESPTEVSLGQYLSWVEANQPPASLSSMVFFLQTASMIYAQTGLKFVRILSVFNLNVSKATARCLAPNLPLIADVLQAVCLPLGAMLLIMLIYQLRRLLPIELRSHHCRRALLNVVLFAFAPLTRECVEIFVCRKVDGEQLLALDMSVKCWEGEHLITAIVAGFIGATVGFGLPVLIIIRAKPYFDDKVTLVGALDHAATSQSREFVHWDAVFNTVKSRAYWWPGYMMALKLIMNALFVAQEIQVDQHDKKMGLWMLIVLTLSAFVAHVAYPYRWNEDNTVQMLVFLSLTAMIGVTIARGVESAGSVWEGNYWDVQLITVFTVGPVTVMFITGTAINEFLAPWRAKKKAARESETAKSETASSETAEARSLQRSSSRVSKQADLQLMRTTATEPIHDIATENPVFE